MTIFAPLKQQGAVSSVRILRDGSDGEAVVETRVSSARGGGLGKTHTYVLRDGWQGVLIRSTLRNEGKEDRSVEMVDQWGPYSASGEVGGVMWGDAVDPADGAGYAFAWVPAEGALPAERNFALSDRIRVPAPGPNVELAWISTPWSRA